MPGMISDASNKMIKIPILTLEKLTVLKRNRC